MEDMQQWVLHIIFFEDKQNKKKSSAEQGELLPLSKHIRYAYVLV